MGVFWRLAQPLAGSSMSAVARCCWSSYGRSAPATRIARRRSDSVRGPGRLVCHCGAYASAVVESAKRSGAPLERAPSA